MDALDQSDELMRRSGELRARSMRVRAAADRRMEESRRLIAAADGARKALRRAHGRQAAGREGRAGEPSLPPTRAAW